VVARVRNRDVSREEFRRHLVKVAKAELDDPQTPSGSVFEFYRQEIVVAQEASRLGIVVTQQEYDARYAQLDAEVRRVSEGKETLDTVRRQQRHGVEEFRANLETLIKKERIAGHPSYLGDRLPKDDRERQAQVEVVFGELMKKARIERSGLPAGTVARINGRAITDVELGLVLEQRLGKADVLKSLNRLLLALLLDQEGLGMSEADVTRVLEADRPLWERQKEDATQPEIRSLSFDSFLQWRYGAPVAEMRASPYWRGLLALKERVRASITDDEVSRTWVEGAQTEWGPVVLVTDIAVSFQIPKAVTEPTVRRRTQEEARRTINDLARRLSSESGDAIVKEVQQAKDRGVVAEKRRVRFFENEMKLFDAVKDLPDGAWTPVVELLSEYHLMKREGMRPAQPLEVMRPIVREKLVGLRTNDWISKRMEEEVRIADEFRAPQR
jgi:hypothetical protein